MLLLPFGITEVRVTMKQILSATTRLLGEIKGNEYANAYMKVKDVDRRLSLENVSSRMKILDVGGGLGLDDLLFACKGAYPVVLDLSHEDLRTGKAIAGDLGLHDKIDYLVADALKLPFKDHSFDMVVSFSSMEHLRCRSKAKVWITQMVHVLKNRGKLIQTTSNRLWLMYPIARLLITLKHRPPEIFFTPQELAVELTKNGILLEAFDAGVVYYRGYTLIPFNRVNETLENLLNHFGRFRCFKVLCGRMGFGGIKKNLTYAHEIASFYDSLRIEKENFALTLPVLLQSRLLITERGKNGEIVGVAGISKGHSFFLVVKSKYQNQKIGQKLTEKVIDLARRKNHHYLTLNVFQSNFKAFHIYRKFGFKTIFTSLMDSRKTVFMILPLDFQGSLYKNLISIIYKWHLHSIFGSLQKLRKRFRRPSLKETIV